MLNIRRFAFVVFAIACGSTVVAANDLEAGALSYRITEQETIFTFSYLYVDPQPQQHYLVSFLLDRGGDGTIDLTLVEVSGEPTGGLKTISINLRPALPKRK